MKEILVEFEDGNLTAEKINKNKYILNLNLKECNIDLNISEISLTLMQQALRRIKKQKLEENK